MTRIIMVTNKGEINLNLFDEDAPMTVASFLFLAKQGYYNSLNAFRVEKERNIGSIVHFCIDAK